MLLITVTTLNLDPARCAVTSPGSSAHPANMARTPAFLAVVGLLLVTGGSGYPSRMAVVTSTRRNSMCMGWGLIRQPSSCRPPGPGDYECQTCINWSHIACTPHADAYHSHSHPLAPQTHRHTATAGASATRELLCSGEVAFGGHKAVALPGQKLVMGSVQVNNRGKQPVALQTANFKLTGPTGNPLEGGLRCPGLNIPAGGSLQVWWGCMCVCICQAVPGFLEADMAVLCAHRETQPQLSSRPTCVRSVLCESTQLLRLLRAGCMLHACAGARLELNTAAVAPASLPLACPV